MQCLKPFSGASVNAVGQIGAIPAVNSDSGTFFPLEDFVSDGLKEVLIKKMEEGIGWSTEADK